MNRRRWAFDIAVAVVVVGLGQLEAWWGIDATRRQGPHWAEALLFAVTGLCLVWRRMNPMAVLVAITAASLAEFAIFGSPEGQGLATAPMIAAYTVAKQEEPRRSWWALVVSAVLWAGWSTLDPANGDASVRLMAGIWYLPYAVAWLVGALVRATRQTTEQRRLVREQRASREVAEERNRIARELHDVIGHSVSVMTVQTSAVRRRLTPEQDQEREALESVETVGREALAEMRRMVGVLRRSEESAGLEPTPGLTQLDRLVEKFRAAGLAVQLEVTGQARPLAPGLDLTAYRLVQEGLTNTLRHAVEPRCAEVSVDYAVRDLTLTVRDDGRPVVSVAPPGHGLLGMRERVAVYGGRLDARPRRPRGFELVATLPLETS